MTGRTLSRLSFVSTLQYVTWIIWIPESIVTAKSFFDSAAYNATLVGGMLRDQFQQIWQTTKTIVDDLQFVRDCDSIHSLVVEDIVVLGTEPQMIVNAHYDCRTQYFSVNFAIPGVGPVHRYDCGGDRHRDVGRYHEHWIESARCVRQNLPNAIERSDLQGLSPERVWRRICAEASITYTGKFFPPEVLCS